MRVFVESDDLFFAYSEKGNRNLDRKPKQRGEKASKPGISNEKVAVIATCDRTGNKDLKVVTTGRISKKDLDKAFAGKLDKITVLCSQTLTTHFLGEENKEKRGLKILNNKLLNSSLSCFINFLRFQPVAAKKALICGEFSPQR